MIHIKIIEEAQMNNLKKFMTETQMSGKDVGIWINKTRQWICFWSGKADNVADEIMKEIYINYIKYAKAGLKYSEEALRKLKQGSKICKRKETN